MRDKKIGWQKYEDVLESQLNCPFLQELMGLLQEQEQNLINELLQSGEYEGYEQHEEKVLASSPAVGISEEMLKEASVLASFDCWVGHTNFDITPSVRDALEEIAGVEVLVILTRYRFFIGIGRMFSFRDVRVTIEKEVLSDGYTYEEEKIDSTDSLELVEEIKKSLMDSNHWAIFVFPNGEVDYISADSLEDKAYKETLTLYRHAETITGGFIIKSGDK